MANIQPIYALLLVAVYFGVKYTGKTLEALLERHMAGADKRLVNLVYFFVKYVVYGASVLIALFAMSGLFGADYDLSGMAMRTIAANLGNIAVIVITIALGWFIANVLDIIFDDLRHKTALSVSLVDILHIFLRYLVYILASLMVFLTILSALGLSTLATSMLTLFTVFIGLIVSFAATGTIGNALAGLILISWRPIRKGDRVLVADGVYGDVVSLDVMFTQVKTIDEEIISVPNLVVLGRPLKNHSALERCLVKSKVTIGYDVRREKVEELLLNAAGKTLGILKLPSPFVLVTSLDNYYVSYEVKGYTDMPNKLVETLSELNCNILDVFGSAGVQIMSPDQYSVKLADKR